MIQKIKNIQVFFPQQGDILIPNVPTQFPSEHKLRPCVAMSFQLPLFLGIYLFHAFILNPAL